MAITTPNPRGKMANGFDPSRTDALNETTRSLIERRSRSLGPAYRLFYANPVEVCRARGVRLWDSAGNEYLDAYNNVVAVGHCNPRVIEAVSRQMAELCTHTRYLQHGILDYAESLLPTFEDNIAHLMFTCTGSEANDLATRVAMHHTGQKGIIITSEAYHGNSWLTAGYSPSMGENSPLGTWVRRVPAPDSYRIPHAQMGEWMAAQVAEQIADLERRGEGVAAFIADSLFSSDGIYADPTSLLGPVAEVVRRAGGIIIADEVQSGFARSGSHFWGHQRHGIRPEIVTMGKPMGNGYPVAGVALAPEVIARFGHEMRYFNTFGGNTVAMAAAQATLDVIRDDGLQENAARVGAQIRDGLSALMQRYDFIGDVRGAGLYVGVEVVSDRGGKVADAAIATRIVNDLRERRVLISSTGPAANVLKIRPPLVFSSADADELLARMEESFAAI